jgi:hypothetical protein
MPLSDEAREALREEGLEKSANDEPAVRDDSLFDVPRLPADGHRIVGEDPGREELMNDLATEPARPLTDEEEDAAEHDAPRPERVYAPASARVPKEPAPGDDKLIRG